MAHPLKINLGSGKDFREDSLNIDISDYWNPDIVADAGVPALVGAVHDTKRFGKVTLAADSFDEITTVDVLEHVPDLVATVTNCLNLLKIGGKFNILVPYDLSYGAWQDPTHIRAFNERSWLYYTDWFWYLGWKTHRFVTRSLQFALSPQGEEMRKAGQNVDAIVRTPRMVDSMQVVMEKIALSDQDRQTLEMYTKQHRKAS